MIYRKMTLRERIFGRDPDTAEVVVYKNYTLADWFWGRPPHPLTPVQRCVGIGGIIVILTVIALYFAGYLQ
jgi:hypothetical protein